MPKRMLIDASHPEETRVVIVDGQRVDEFDFEAASKRPLKGNIYLAKVTRVEPSLQAAFVEYGGNRQGFLAFSEIHPDYYQIPVADRMALIAEQQEEARRRADEEFESVEMGTAPVSDEDLAAQDEDEAANGDGAESDEGSEEPSPDVDEDAHLDTEAHGESATEARDDIVNLAEDESAEGIVDEQTAAEAAIVSAEFSHEDSAATEETENVLDQQPESEMRPQEQARPAQPLRAPRPPQRWMRRRHYKIQEVIKRRQVILVQVVKEERGTKGAALTTYLSLAGRYCVLMPNTPRGGGISRKITNVADRNRLKSAAATLELPEGMGLIIRTAGANRTKLEIKRDYEYLLRLWDQIRELTLKSNAPSCVYEEGDIIKRAIRDLYSKDVSEVLVEGEEGYRNAKEFMRMLMPSHAKNVKPYRDPIPIFQHHHVEAQLDAMFSPTVTLKSGGYIVINQTEALVSIDVNSGRATREHSIEETAHKTNLEAAEEIARQLRLRDLAGLIVIDFIDMEDQRNDRDVERRLRDAVKHDRARVQIGKISQFGLLEMSRQRLRAGVVAGSTVPCPHCGGQGIIRSVESTALRVLRALDEEGQRQRASAINVRVANDVALYALNQKRRELARIESDYGMTVTFEPNAELMAGSFELERVAARATPPPQKPVISAEAGEATPTDVSEPIEEVEDEHPDMEAAIAESAPNGSLQQPTGAPGKKKRRRRRRGSGHGRPSNLQEPIPSVAASQHAQHEQDTQQGQSQQGPQTPPANGGETWPANGSSGQQQGATGTGGPRRRRRRRRKPHNGPSTGAHAEVSTHLDTGARPLETDGVESRSTSTEVPAQPAVAPNAPSEPVWSLGSDRAEAAAASAHEPVGEMYYRREETLESRAPDTEKKPERRVGKTVPVETISAEQNRPREEPAKSDETAQPQRKGWWQRQFRRE